MTKTRSYRFLFLLLAILFVVGLVPTAALAAELPEDEAFIECSCEDCEIPEDTEEPADISDAYVIGEDTQAAALVPEPEAESEPEQEEEPASEPELAVSGLMWELNDGLLFIYGSGKISRFSSADEQPWRDRRNEIIEVMFDESADMTIESLAYWFAGCTNLTRADLPDYIREIGYHAFHDCHALHDVMLCCEETPKLIPGAFITDHPLEWEVNYDPRLQFTVLNAGAMYDLCDYDWTADGTPVHIRVQAPVKLLAATPMAKAAPMLAASASGYCSSCKTTCPYTLDYEQWTDNVHCVRHWCSNCGKDQCGGVLGEDHSFTHYNSSYDRCSKCGYLTDCTHAPACTHPSYRTVWVTSCDYERYCTSCGAFLESGTQHGPYTYGDWYYYNGTYHRRSYTCSYGDSGTYYENERHSTTTTYQKYSSTQHKVVSYCSVCDSDVGSASYASHSFRYGSWESYNGNQHRRLKTCSDCGYSDYEYANHSLSYGSWTSANATQHKRTVTCSCGYSTTEYADHSLTVTRQSISDTQHKVTSKCSTCGYTTTANEANTFTYGEWQSYNGTQHRRLRTCSACGYSDYEYANHSLSYGSWTSANATQHKRTVTCSCGYSTTEYADHNLTVTRQSISDTQHKVTSKCSTCGYTTTANEAHTFTYGEWQSYSDTQHRRTKSCDCGYSGYDYGDHTDANGDGTCDNCGYLMSHFSVTVPANLSLTVSQDGTVHAAVNAAIVNNSTGAVKVTAVTVRAGNGWTLVPYSTNMANAKVDTKQIGFTINNAATKQTGSSEALTLGSGWNIAKNADLPLNYDAVVSAMSEPVNEQVLTLIFILDWAN